MNPRFLLIVLLSGLFLSSIGCSTRRSGSVYSAKSLGTVGRADKGVVVNVRLVNVEGTKQTGTMLGGVTGAAVGYDLGKKSGDATKILGSAAGAIVGGVVGGGTEELITRTTAYEYIVEMDSGHMETIVQKDDEPIHHGDRVLLLKGPDSKIILDPGV